MIKIWHNVFAVKESMTPNCRAEICHFLSRDIIRANAYRSLASSDVNPDDAPDFGYGFAHRTLRGETPDRVCLRIGFPDTIRVEQDSEFISRDMDLWAYQRGVALDLSGPGKPADHAFIEAFNGQFRAECLYRHWFRSLEDAVQKLEAWRRDYNEDRPRSAIGHKIPAKRIGERKL